MKIILSRKGIDSSVSSGKSPSPILPDGRMISLPICDKNSSVSYGDIRWQEYNLGVLVEELTGGRIPAWFNAHLDPDINCDSLPRCPGWMPIFGQTAAAQGHLRNCGIGHGDVFLFWGLFRDTVFDSGKLKWNKKSRLRHVLWGWLQIDDVLSVDACDQPKYKWAEYHPHFQRSRDPSNTVYIARKKLAIPGVTKGIAGAGVFSKFSKQLQLTAATAETPCLWELPQWFFPRDGKCPLTYHSNMMRWHKKRTTVQLDTVSRGQEFVLNTREYPEAIEWLHDILAVSLS
jgi:hypothetical protein